MFCILRLTVYLCSSAVGLLKTVRLLERYIDTSESELVFDHVLVGPACDKVVDVGIAVSWDTRSMNIVLGMPFSYMVMVCDWTLITRKGPIVQFDN